MPGGQYEVQELGLMAQQHLDDVQRPRCGDLVKVVEDQQDGAGEHSEDVQELGEQRLLAGCVVVPPGGLGSGAWRKGPHQGGPVRERVLLPRARVVMVPPTSTVGRSTVATPAGTLSRAERPFPPPQRVRPAALRCAVNVLAGHLTRYA
ncbi:hypothetical protein LWC33_19215 [Pseudonocardia sp. RS11V-5]|uniref:hypothetical protein n=1 Tax=Pseudonocardia terrae TaxID=2905831 RepID=UPI001E4DFE95|nr:hypothetical protein [Pseudonocardia terrae]MCE3553574.1 hypothetical protein [Pseudonocardia terrae]